ncbi:Ion transport protein [compost metagenome]
MTTDTASLSLRQRSYRLLFDNHSRSGRRMEAFWVSTALLSVVLLFLEPGGSALYAPGQQAIYLFFYAEVFFTVIFTIEYLLRLWSTPRDQHYARSFFGVVDLLTVLPMYIIWFYPHMTVEFVMLLRVVRILRVLRVLKLLRYMSEMGMIWRSIKLARHKLAMFFGFVAVVLCVFGGLMYAIEGGERGLYQPGGLRLLGGSDADHRGIRRYCSPYPVGAVTDFGTYPAGLFNHRGADRHSDGLYVAGAAT